MKELRTPWSAPLLLALILTVLSGFSPAASTTTGSLVLAKSSMNFGNVVMGSSTQVTETIWNPTSSDVTIASASIEGTDFQISSATFPVTVSPRRQISLVIIFSPSAAGNSAGSFLISLDGTTPYATVPLYGVAVQPGQFSASLPSVNFSAGSSQRVPETISNVGATPVVIQAAITSGNGFAISGPGLPLVLRPNQSAVFTVYTTSTGAVSGNINFSGYVRWWTPGERGNYQYAATTSARTSLVVPVTGAVALPGQLTAAPSAVSFGNIQVGSTQNLPATLTNSGGSPVTINQASANGTGFTLSGLPLPMTLAPGESATFSASFSPVASGAAKGSISLLSNASNPATSIALTGSANAPGQLSLSPASLNFGTVPVGKSQQLSATLTATGSSVTVSSASVSSSEFAFAGVPLPVTIPAGQSASFTVTFSPQSSGAASAGVTFASTASTVSESLSGAGSAPAPVQHSVALTWTPGGSNVAGYNVYRGTQTGGPYTKLNSAVSAATTFGDGSVTAGQSYFYVTTALDSTGAESSHSNEVNALIPSP